MTVAELIIKALEVEGVKYVFGVPGEETEDLLFALEQSSIIFVPTRHEQGAAFIADVYGRTTGKAGVCLATLGPGATNLITGIADAYLDKAPVVAITAQASSVRVHKESHQVLDILNMLKPITKWNASIQNPLAASEIVRKAFKMAQSEKPGPTHIELPEDVAAEVTSLPALVSGGVRRSAPDHKAIQVAMELLGQAQAPIILAGNGAIRKRASKHIREFVAQTDIPVISTFMGKGAIDDRDPHSLYTIGVPGRDYQMCALERADLVLAIGYDIGEYDPAKWNPTGDKQIIHIDFDPAEVYEYYQPKVEVIADISASMWELNRQVAEKQLKFHPTWFANLRETIESDFRAYRMKPGEAFTVPGSLHIIREYMRPGDMMLSDVGSHKMWIGRNFPVYEANSTFISNGLATMGIALPGGIGAKLAHPERRVVAAMGDGGFLMNVQEIETAKRMGLGYPIIVFNDNDYGLIRWKQTSSTGKTFGTSISNPDFVKLAESFGIEGHSPKTLDELDATLKRVIEGQVLSIVEIAIDPRVNFELTQKLNQNICERFEFPELSSKGEPS
ncbi:MAG: acetolactate synthase large subunit [Candidatus Marinimicrobia bacterium]|nr:acetolactate synthase large subunit [Candidatus Neomarinimicrobiota bacterium]